ncbi:16451_t:CDS:2 [Racocetra fulgida]|uniref:16451_t:CDS:1 n=1 Tax=Racocetra fulgida TaxID=60492 RepID=A0A9N9AER9_9GLOM|nr:16451_t:CDS:2 [Racocetra fulgida]
MQGIDTDEKAKDLQYTNANQDSIYNDANQDSIHNDANKDSIHNDANKDSIHNDANKDSIYIEANGKIHDEEKNIEKKLVDNDIAEMISAAVSTDDDPTLPCLTFRYWVLRSSHRGAGMLNLSFDWNAIGQASPLFTPW